MLLYCSAYVTLFFILYTGECKRNIFQSEVCKDQIVYFFQHNRMCIKRFCLVIAVVTVIKINTSSKQWKIPQLTISCGKR